MRVKDRLKDTNLRDKLHSELSSNNELGQEAVKVVNTFESLVNKVISIAGEVALLLAIALPLDVSVRLCLIGVFIYFSSSNLVLLPRAALALISRIKRKEMETINRLSIRNSELIDEINDIEMVKNKVGVSTSHVTPYMYSNNNDSSKS